MSGGSETEFLRYRRARFVARFPQDRRYSESHYWLREASPDRWRIGYTKFAMRMLGEAVEADFEVAPGSEVELGQVVGWLEGFKAVTDVFAPMSGVFVGPNPELDAAVGAMHDDPYDRGWLYEIEGQPGQDCFDAAGYAAFLDGTIDRMVGEDPSLAAGPDLEDPS